MADGPTPINPEMAANAAQQQLVQQMLEASVPRPCKECGCMAYEQAIAIMEVSALHPGNPSGKEAALNMPVLCCIKCKTVFDPTGKIKDE